ncbi:HNH endonuclease [bacterium endosymbiont of Bathymodiolus sp. 5 South]|uniref:HNH endonuclease n=1 Tax=bacterium endosymbiont of Bathymodiolus sp. 5 South TaxID=1181670 RepID=UPI0010BB6033|nr:HNH endonuclease [bacterium endosymbiont of Bathymodiolus sp. 5 South]SSC08517.1 Phage-associated homing endonuclease [bacterium endosymbiont of Bathymodiolus sp. 5 South]
MNKKKKKLTRQRLMTLLNYNEHTGFFTNKISRGRVSSGELAGTIDGGGYVQIKIDDVIHFGHRLALMYKGIDISESNLVIDHKNHIRHDNRYSNIRILTQADNCSNRSRSVRNKSGFTGVSIRVGQKLTTYEVSVRKRNKGIYKRFTNIEEAVLFRNKIYIDLGFSVRHGEPKKKQITILEYRALFNCQVGVN